ncbi:MAG: HTTM domain-containing protein [Chloroflexota bacterium]
MPKRLNKPTSVLPLIIFRVVFGILMFVSTVRFITSGWIDAFYLQPDFHFTYYGFSWIKPAPGVWLYIVYGIIALLSLNIAFGLAYRFSMTAFFLLFTYTELLDKTYYLNHYYFISVLSFLLIFLPLHRRFSLDTVINPKLKTDVAPTWTIWAIRLQLGLVYVFAGIAKLNTDWLLNALPLKIWLNVRTDLPLIGWLFDYSWTAHLMSWTGAVYDLTIVFLLLYRPTRMLAYLAVIGFHLMTGFLFPIGMFPYIMIACTLIFFSAEDWLWLQKSALGQKAKQLFEKIGQWLKLNEKMNREAHEERKELWLFFKNLSFLRAFYNSIQRPLVLILLVVFFALQICLPLRHWLYPGNVMWTEEGYRFAWKVMLVEKTGHVTFIVTDPSEGQSWSVFPGDYLTYQQEKQMAFQPDMILAFAHHLEQQFKAQGHNEIEIRAEAYVSLNGRPSQLLIDPTIDLTTLSQTLFPKPWIRTPSDL